MNNAIADISDRQEQVVRQFTLNTGVPSLRVWIFPRVTAKLMQYAGGVKERWVKSCGRGDSKRISVPLTVMRNVRTKRVHVGDTRQQVSIANRQLVVTVFVGATIQEVQGEAH